MGAALGGETTPTLRALSAEAANAFLRAEAGVAASMSIKSSRVVSIIGPRAAGLCAFLRQKGNILRREAGKECRKGNQSKGIRATVKRHLEISLWDTLSPKTQLHSDQIAPSPTK